jgi:hypothetical protein
MKPQIDSLVADTPNAAPIYLEATDWLTDTSGQDLESIYLEFNTKFRNRLHEVIGVLSLPHRQFYLSVCGLKLGILKQSKLLRGSLTGK